MTKSFRYCVKITLIQSLNDLVSIGPFARLIDVLVDAIVSSMFQKTFYTLYELRNNDSCQFVYLKKQVTFISFKF